MQLKEILKDIKIARDNLKNVGKSATIFGSARFSEDNRYVKDAQKLCEGLADLGYSIITGGGGGIMQGANRGAFARTRTHSVGFNIMLPFEQKSNGFLTRRAKAHLSKTAKFSSSFLVDSARWMSFLKF